MKSAITAIGTAVPPFKQNQTQAAEIVANALSLNPIEKRLLKSVYKATGIDYRHSVLSDFCKQPGEYEFFPNDVTLPFPTTAKRMQMYKETACKLAVNAANDCLAKRQATITHVITVSCTGMYAPGIDIELVQHLKLNSNVKRTMINFMGCYGSFNAIKVADSICKADPTAKVLIVSVELCTLHFQKTDSMDSLFSNAIFADGAGALLIEAENTAEQGFILEDFHCDLLPQTSEHMAWHIADSGFDIVLSSYVPQAIESGINNFFQRLLDQNNMTFADIDYYAIHPGGKKILQACEKALTITPDDNQHSYAILREYGNMSSATVLFVLNEFWKNISNEDHNKTIFSCAFGPGLTLESMILKIKNNAAC